MMAGLIHVLTEDTSYCCLSFVLQVFALLICWSIEEARMHINQRRETLGVAITAFRVHTPYRHSLLTNL